MEQRKRLMTFEMSGRVGGMRPRRNRAEGRYVGHNSHRSERRGQGLTRKGLPVCGKLFHSLRPFPRRNPRRNAGPDAEILWIFAGCISYRTSNNRPCSLGRVHPGPFHQARDLHRGDRVKKRKSYSGDFKAKVLSELLNGKKSLRELADQYQIHPNQIKNWKSLLMKRAQFVLEDKRHR